MLYIRSFIFNVLFYISNAVQMIFWIPAFFILPKEQSWKIAKMWGYSHLWLQNKICGTRFDFRGLENIPSEGGYLVASKHQSAWETYTIILFLADTSYILKKELTYIPVFGWYMQKFKVVPVERGKKGVAMLAMTKEAGRQIREDQRQILIYPEGTRTRPGADPHYKYGITHLYSELDEEVLPVALNSGLFWGRQSFLRYPGKIVLEFLPVIEPGLEKDVFAEKLRSTIEIASDRLILEAADSADAPPLALEVREKVGNRLEASS